MKEFSIVQPILKKGEDEGSMEVNIPGIDVSFGMPLSLVDDVETWLHEFTEQTLSDVLNENGYSMDTISKMIGHAEAIYVWYRRGKFWCPIDHLLASLSFSASFLVGNMSFSVRPDNFWRLLRFKRRR